MINAESELQIKMSMDQLTGSNSKIYEHMRTQLITMLAHCEAYIDFEADELSDPRLAETFRELIIKAKEIQHQIAGYIEQAKVAEVIREGFKISIIGPPNAGKSTLMNMLAKR